MSEEIKIHIDAANKREGLPDCGQYDTCPHCGKPLEQGFGLAGGGFGVYEYCEEHGVVAKTETDV